MLNSEKTVTMPCREKLQYMVGGLLYVPALNAGLAKKIRDDSFECLTSVAICLEDSIRDDALDSAEKQVFRTLDEIGGYNIRGDRLPLIFIRIRTPEHMRHMYELLKPYRNLVTGYILPKFDLSNCEGYRDMICGINKDRKEPVYVMPILESRMIADIKSRTDTLIKIRDNIDSMKDYVLNVRVGGNDLSNLYGLRRGTDQNIYQIGVVRDILMDIINVFASDYVVSGPVWEYFGRNVSEPWAEGLREELSLDRLNGFIGKTAIHPSQLPLIYESMKVKSCDYNDALRILGWSRSAFGVEKSSDDTRMNEVKCHGRWALRTAALGEIYGISND